MLSWLELISLTATQLPCCSFSVVIQAADTVLTFRLAFIVNPFCPLSSVDLRCFEN